MPDTVFKIAPSERFARLLALLFGTKRMSPGCSGTSAAVPSKSCFRLTASMVRVLVSGIKRMILALREAAVGVSPSAKREHL